jgi:hypothetical protein
MQKTTRKYTEAEVISRLFRESQLLADYLQKSKVVESKSMSIVLQQIDGIVAVHWDKSIGDLPELSISNLLIGGSINFLNSDMEIFYKLIGMLVELQEMQNVLNCWL